MQTTLRQPAQAESKTALSYSAYILMSLPLGMMYFVFIVVGLALSAGLIPIFIGLPILLGFLTLTFSIGGFERQLARSVLGLEEPEPRHSSEFEPTGFFRRLGRTLADPGAYSNMLMCLLKLPISLFNFVVTVTLVCVSTALTAAPIVYLAIEQSLGIDIFEQSQWLIQQLPDITLTSLQISFICTAIGIVSLFITVSIIRGLARWMAGFTLLLAKEPRTYA